MRRHRILRDNAAIRGLIRETRLSAQDFIVPLFVVEGNEVTEEIPSMPGYYRRSLDRTIQEVKRLNETGLTTFLLFVKVPEGKKDNTGREALNDQGLMQLAIRGIKDAVPDILLISDVALDPYSSYGHDGIVEGERIVNDATVDLLAQISVSHALAGVDFVAPSDMMDGRVAAIRGALEGAGLDRTGILAYSAKYASAYYGPFRDALDSAPGFGDKRTYQMDTANIREAVREVISDIDEGADIVMVKPALAYLDVIRAVREASHQPVAAYQVSGEYAMIKAAAARGWLDEQQVVAESLLSIKRAGADAIASYYAEYAVRIFGL
jgi:porphobilinogen synthase